MQVILTGGNRGIGAQMTSQLRARGDTVLATSRDGSTDAVLDVTNAKQVQSFAADYQPVLDLLICNAGVYLDKGHALETGYERQLWTDTFGVKRHWRVSNNPSFAASFTQKPSPKDRDYRVANGLFGARRRQRISLPCV